ncbi:amino acid permease [Reticulibacter mediterranei]|uniref:Amino acid permease n=1 Tax=Reticulibacter mediterranei TaxID=2778369 RepID=A0A8J3ILX1_9CHLR|nr:APC family permease [Reticulibacter mediterranei]GHO91911.1 amino acid permease [Reticulibacter mediterranei]
METTETSVHSADVLPSERIAGGILPKVLNSFDMVAIFVAIVLFITNAPGVAAAGSVGYIYWILGFLAFLVPGAIVTGQLGLMFPGEGSIYLWTHKAFGSFMGFFAGFCAWWPGILSIIVPGVVVVTFIQHLGSLFNATLLDQPWEEGLVILAVLGVSLVLSLIRFRVTQNIISTVFVAYAAAILLIGLSAVLWLISGNHPTSDIGGTWNITFGSSGNFTTFGFVILALLGIEVPLNMGVEINDVRAITRYLLWGSVVVMLAYLIATFGVMMVVPVKDQPNTTAIAEAVQIGFGSAGTILAVIFDIIIIGAFLFNASVFNYSFGRLLFISGLDRRLPAAMSKVNSQKVPWVAVVVQTIIAGLFSVAIFIIAPLLPTGIKPGDLATLMYYIILAAVTLIWTLSMCILFVDVIIIRRKYHEAFTRIRLAPDWVFYLCAALGLVSSGVGFYATITAPWVPTLIDLTGWNTWVIGIALLSLVIGVIVYFIGQASARVAAAEAAIEAEALPISAAPEEVNGTAESVEMTTDNTEISDTVEAPDSVEVAESTDEEIASKTTE